MLQAPDEDRNAVAGRAGLRAGQGVASRRPPRGLPHGSPEAELRDVEQRLHQGPPDHRAVGPRQVNEMPH